ncbi:TnsA endonuclease N-terminal domain-containing protein [Chromobacterium sp. ATCC 53434]|uniref:TnsA endonuclease N-terminal domain-containing protein n=1 Tax=Chromobacterium sp. (strain ATCC 53434 / SC 14030) TaxID=2059672 RepID=UPI0013053603|nr:TnsA endonuclease N-terminal domain-containing protein [Chromobacterium sp. ATCC 53434]
MTIALESQLETPYCLLLERDSNVIGYRCQALEIEYSKGRFYFPDFLIRMRDGRWLVHEIKPSREHLSDETRECFDVAGVLLANCGFYFSLIDAMDLPRGSYLENLYFLYHRSISKLWSKQECEQALEHITTLSGACPLDELHTLLADAGLSPLLADHLLFHGFLIADLSRPLRLHTPVRLAL